MPTAVSPPPAAARRLHSPGAVPAMLLATALLAVAAGMPPPASAQATGAIEGRVRDAVTGGPVAGAEVQIWVHFGGGGYLTLVTDARGRYRAGGMEPGSHLVYARTSAGYIGELSDGTRCRSGLSFTDRFGYRCDFDEVWPPAATVEAGGVTTVDFDLDLGGTIAGRVAAAESGEPVPATVAVSTPRGRVIDEVETDAEGRWRIPALPTGSYRLNTQNWAGFADEVWDGHHCVRDTPGLRVCDATLGTAVWVALRREVEGIDFFLERLGAIAGRVTHAPSGAGLPQVEITLFGPHDTYLAAVTGADGGYLVGGLLPGVYRIAASSRAGWVDEVYDDLPCPNLACETSLGAPVATAIGVTSGGIDFALDFGGAIAGTVESDAGDRLAGVAVHLWDRDRREVSFVYTEDDGRFRFRGLPAGDYLLSTAGASFQGFADEVWDGAVCGIYDDSCDLDLGVPVAVTLGAESAVRFTLEPLGAIAGSVVDGSTGEPVAGLPVVIADGLGGQTQAWTGADGRFDSSLPRGSYTVETSGWWLPSVDLVDELYRGVPCFNGRCDRRDGTPVPVASGETTDGVDFALRRGGSISGRVTFGGSPEPVWYGGTLLSDAAGVPLRSAALDDGHYRFGGLEDGTYFVSTADTGLVDEVYDRLQCLPGLGSHWCEPQEGTPIVIAGGSSATVDFGLAWDFRPGEPCRESPTTLCLQGGRFRVGMRDVTDYSGLARARRLSDSAGAFTLFAGDNVEAVVRVIDGCAAFDRFWVFIAWLTGLGADIAVLDTVTGYVRVYYSYDPPLDTDAFRTCGAAAAQGTAPASGPPESPVPGALGAPFPQPGATGPSACEPGPWRLCLLGGRFEVEAQWADGAGGGGDAGAVPLGDRSGYLWFDRPGSPELAVKALDACTQPRRPGFWIFAAGLTDREATLRVRDTVTGETSLYQNPAGTPFPLIRDTGFTDCP